MKFLLKQFLRYKLNVVIFINVAILNLILIDSTCAQIGVDSSEEVDFFNLHGLVLDNNASSGVFEWSDKEKKYILVFAKISSAIFPDNPLFKNQCFGRVDVYNKFKKQEIYEATYYFHGDFDDPNNSLEYDRLNRIKAYSNNGKAGFIGNDMKLEKWSQGIKFTLDGWILSFKRSKFDSLTTLAKQVEMVNELIDGLLKNITPKNKFSLSTIPQFKVNSATQIYGDINDYSELLTKQEINVTVNANEKGSIYDLRNSIQQTVENNGWYTLIHLPKLEKINAFVDGKHFFVLEIIKGNKRHTYVPVLMPLPYTIKVSLTDEALNHERINTAKKVNEIERKRLEAEEDKQYYIDKFKKRVISELKRGDFERLNKLPAVYKTYEFWGDLAINFYIGEKVEIEHIKNLTDDNRINGFLRWYCNFVYTYNGDFELIDQNILEELFNSYVHSYSSKCKSSLPQNYKTLTFKWTENVTTGYTQNQILWGNTLLNAGRDYQYEQVNKSREVYINPRFYDAFIDFGDRSFSGPTQEMYFISQYGCKAAETLHLGENLLKAITSDIKVKLTEEDLFNISKPQNYSKLIDDLIYENSAKWIFNKYLSGGVSNLVIKMDSKGLPEHITANYNYSKVATVKLTFKEGLPECLYFHDFPNRCEAPSRKIIFSYSKGAYKLD